jgi:glycosyltransferase involved in cell wall biosynthesis
MKIIQVVPRYPPRTGGVETHVREVSERLVERGHDVTVLTADNDDDVATRETRDGVEVIRHAGIAPSGAFHVAPGILQTLRRYDADAVHAHNYHSLPLFFAALEVDDARFVVTPHYHGGSASSFRDQLLSVYRPIGGWALRRADEVIAVSDWEREQLREDFGVESTVIPNGVDIERFRNTEPRQRDRPYLLTVGRLEEYKGVQHVIRALPEIPEYDLLIAGSGDYKRRLREIAVKEGVNSRVKFLGYVADEDLPGLYAGAAALVTMSSFEAYGMTVGEALAAGTPTVVRESGALEDWVNRNDCTGVTSPNPASVAKAVNKTVDNESDIESLPTWEEAVNDTETRYESVV